jgi:hypothetical protein
MTVQITGWTRLLEYQQAQPVPWSSAQAGDGEAEGSPPNPPVGGSGSSVGSAGTRPPVAAGGPAPAAAVGLDPSLLDGVSPEMILGLVRLRMGDADMQIQSRSEEILRSTDRANELSNQLQALEAIKAQAVSQGGNDPSIQYVNGDRDSDHLVQLHGQELTVEEVARRYGLSAELEGLQNGQSIRASAIGDLVESRRQELQRANSGNEIKMMELQQLMQRRAEILSLGTNLLRTLHEATQQIVRNLGA